MANGKDRRPYSASPRDASSGGPVSETPVLEYAATVLSAWLIPGAGHWLLGYRVRGALLGGALLGLFWFGQVLAVPEANSKYPRIPMAVCRNVSPVFFACQLGNGLSALISNVLWGAPRYGKDNLAELDRHLPRRLGLGVLFTSVSGLLNYLLVLHILDPRTWEEAKRCASP